jgi:2-oxoglutarate dehydrogenase E2 component (dihydrolipoamide succinyltransferase)
MKTEMVMPQMGESIAEATILKWLKGIGDVVEKDETILEISTDKVDSEIPAPASGTIVEIIANEGDTVAVKSVIAIIDSEGGAAAPQANSQAAATPAPTSAAPAPTSGSVSDANDDRFYSPLVRSIAKQHGLASSELSSIPGTGTNGRVTKDDLMKYLENRSSSSSTPAPSAPVSSPTPSAPSAPAVASTPTPAAAPPRPQYGNDGVEVVPMDKMRKLIAEHMVRSKHTSPHVYSVAEVDVSNIAKWRKANQSAFVAREGFKLSFTPFFLEAAIKSLVQYPGVNASIDGDNIILKRAVNLGCAVALGKGGMEGLIVPVIKNAESLNISGIARSLNDLAQRARDKKLKPDDVQGGTFTVTNPGIFGNIFGCPIINQPQAAILALGAIKKRPVVVGDAIAIREIVYLTLSYDHRIIDGSLAGHFLSHMTKYLENWDMNRSV